MKRGKFKQLSLEERFWASVARTGDDKCWPWIGHIKATGYGQIKQNYKCLMAHRVSYELAHGPIPEDLIICHHCDVRWCVNPRHLFIGTNKDNTTDMFRKGRARPASGERHWKAKLTDADIAAILASTERGIDLAKRYGVSPASISNIRLGQRRTNADRRLREKVAG